MQRDFSFVPVLGLCLVCGMSVLIKVTGVYFPLLLTWIYIPGIFAGGYSWLLGFLKATRKERH